jgi:hypothetical protein
MPAKIKLCSAATPVIVIAQDWSLRDTARQSDTAPRLAWGKTGNPKCPCALRAIVNAKQTSMPLPACEIIARIATSLKTAVKWKTP